MTSDGELVNILRLPGGGGGGGGEQPVASPLRRSITL